MPIGNCRFLYNNLVSASTTTVTASSVKTGQVLSAKKTGTGSALMMTGGTYTANTDLEYTVEIDSISGGAEVGQATFRWKTDQDTTWTASGVTTSGTAITLSNGATVRWISGTGADFVTGDIWYFKTVNRFSSTKLYDYDRDTIYRSSGVASAIRFVFDFGSATSFNSVVLLDHNLTASAVITIEANATDSWGAPSFSETITYVADKILHYTSTTPNYRYARLSITDTTNTDGYIELSEVFIGSYFQPSVTFSPSHSRAVNLSTTEERNRYNVVKKRFHNSVNTFGGSLQYLTSSDITSFDTMVSTIGNRTHETLTPVYFNPDSSVLTDFYLMELNDYSKSIMLNRGGAVFYNVDLALSEFSRSLE